MRGRQARVVLATALLVVGAVASAPAWAQTDDTTTTTTSTTSTTEDDGTSTTFTILPTTSTTDDVLPTTTTTEESTTTTTVVRTTVPQGPVITVPRITTTTELREPAGAGSLPTTTSTPPASGNPNRGLSAGTIVLLIITGLVLVAIVLTFATWRYWLRTTPPGRRASSGTVARHG